MDQFVKKLIFLGLFLSVVLIGSVFAQTQNTAAIERLEKLRAELRETLAKEADAQARLKLIEIEMQPENIQRATLVPSLKPDELREKRRIYLESEMTKARLQIEQLMANKTRLEAEITKVETEVQRVSNEKSPTEAPPKAEKATNDKAEKGEAVIEVRPVEEESFKTAPAIKKRSRVSARAKSRVKPRDF